MDQYIELSDNRVSLVPLNEDHILQLQEICGDPEIWRWFSADLTDKENMKRWMGERLEESNQGTKMSYAVIRNSDQKIAGTTSYGHIDWKEHVLEIGWTWLGSAFMGSGINKHMKFLMLKHAFDTMGVERLEIRTDEVNVRSRRAIEKIGGKLDGILRSHRVTIGGRRRNTAVYSIIREEWNDIRNTIFNSF